MSKILTEQVYNAFVDELEKVSQAIPDKIGIVGKVKGFFKARKIKKEALQTMLESFEHAVEKGYKGGLKDYHRDITKGMAGDKTAINKEIIDEHIKTLKRRNSWAYKHRKGLITAGVGGAGLYALTSKPKQQEQPAEYYTQPQSA